MKRALWVPLLWSAVVVSLAAQAGPAGWKMRIDRSTSASDPDGTGPVKFTEADGAFHTENPVAAIFWNPKNVATGSYTLKATFTQEAPSDHTNYYGLFFGGKDLDGPNETYIYFMVSQGVGRDAPDARFLVKKRNGDAGPNNLPSISQKTASDAIHKLDANGKATNTLEVRVTADQIEYLVNGASVFKTPKTGETAVTDGVYGFRVNHHLPSMTVKDFGLSK
jgi:hypothetical protein